MSVKQFAGFYKTLGWILSTFRGANASATSTWFGLRHTRRKIVVIQPTVVSSFGCFVFDRCFVFECFFFDRCFVFEIEVLRFRVLGASFSRFGCFVLRSSFSSASFSKLPNAKQACSEIEKQNIRNFIYSKEKISILARKFPWRLRESVPGRFRGLFVASIG